MRLLSLALLAAFVEGGDAQGQEFKKQEFKKVEVVRQVVPDAQLDQWVFQQDRNVAGARKRLETQLALQFEDIDRACTLTDAQKKKLQLIGRGDVKRFFDRYEMIKQQFQLAQHDPERGQQAFFQVARPLQMTLQAGLFHEDSLLHRSLHNTLTAEQFARYDALVRDRRAFLHRANIEYAITLLEQGMPLRDAQRRELITLFMNETKPLRKSGQYDFYVIMYQVSRLLEGKLKPLFDNTQWKVVNQLLARYSGMEQFLKQNGLLTDEDDEADKPEALPAPLNK